jgi:ABC-type uncharacterized transport system substrate-binding protein
VRSVKEAVPKAARVAVLWSANDQGMTLRYREIEKAARTLRVEVQALAVREPNDFADAFSAMTGRRPDAMFLVADGLTTMNRQRFVEFAATHRIPAMYEWNFIVREGGLMSYGVSVEDSFRQAALYIDRIFKGAHPADLPAEQPTKYSRRQARWDSPFRRRCCCGLTKASGENRSPNKPSSGWAAPAADRSVSQHGDSLTGEHNET